MARKKEFDGKNVIVKLPYTLIDKLKAATQGKRNCMGKEIRKRLESTFSPGCPLAMTEAVTYAGTINIAAQIATATNEEGNDIQKE